MRCAGFAVVLLMFLPAIAPAQTGYPRTRRSSQSKPTALPESDKVPNPTFEGILKMITKKEIMLQLQSEQTVSIRRDHKTRFVEKDKEIKPEDIAAGTPLAIDVKEDAELKPLAVRVVVNPPPPKAAGSEPRP